jgi:hypothetical protein
LKIRRPFWQKRKRGAEVEIRAAALIVSAGAKIPHWKQPNGSVAPE